MFLKSSILISTLIVSMAAGASSVEENAKDIATLKAQIAVLKSKVMPQDLMPIVAAKKLSSERDVSLHVTDGFLDLSEEAQKQAVAQTIRCFEIVEKEMPDSRYAIRGIRFGDTFQDSPPKFEVTKVFLPDYDGRNLLSLNVIASNEGSLDASECAARLIGNGLR